MASSDAQRRGGGDRRSRSPRSRARDEWISRVITQFSRYPNVRPPGLRVDSSGSFGLENLMEVWGIEQSLSAEDILGAVHKNLLTGDRTLRYAVDTDANSRIVVRAMPARGPRDGAGSRCGSRSNAGSSYTPPPAPPPRVVPPPHPPPPSTWRQLGSRPPPHPPKPPSHPRTAAQIPLLDSSLDDSIRTSNEPGVPSQPRRPDGDAHGRLPTQPDRGIGTKLERWLGWVLKKGYSELGIDVTDGGWARLDTVAAAGRQDRRDFASLDADKLRDILKESDTSGRFEITGAYLRKVRRDERAWTRRSRETDLETDRSLTLAAAVTSVRTSPGEAGGAGNGAGSTRVNAEVVAAEGPAHEAVVDAVDVGGRPCPPGPPGDHWDIYRDHCDDWYFYDGPLGKWWADGSDCIPLPYDEPTDPYVSAFEEARQEWIARTDPRCNTR